MTPFVTKHWHVTQKPGRMRPSRSGEAESTEPGNALDHDRIPRLLERNYVGARGPDHLGDVFCAADTALTNVVAEESHLRFFLSLVGLRLFEQHEIRLIHRHLAEILHERRRRLEIHGALCHRRKTISERSECRRREGIRVTERHRMNLRNVKLAKQHDHVAAHERHVEIARSRPVSVERLVRSKLVSRYGAAAKNHFDAVRSRVAKHAKELLEPPGVAAEGELYHPLAVLTLSFRIERVRLIVGLSVRRIFVGGFVACFIRHEKGARPGVSSRRWSLA